MSKFSDINLMLTSPENKKLHVFCLCETKLKEHKLSSAFKINGFQTPFRKDITSNGVGGIIVYIRNGLMAKRRADLEEGNTYERQIIYYRYSERADWIDRYENLINKVLLAK